MLMGKGGKRTADARGPDNFETQSAAASELGSNIEPDPPVARRWSEFKGEIDEFQIVGAPRLASQGRKRKARLPGVAKAPFRECCKFITL